MELRNKKKYVEDAAHRSVSLRVNGPDVVKDTPVKDMVGPYLDNVWAQLIRKYDQERAKKAEPALADANFDRLEADRTARKAEKEEETGFAREAARITPYVPGFKDRRRTLQEIEHARAYGHSN